MLYSKFYIDHFQNLMADNLLQKLYGKWLSTRLLPFISSSVRKQAGSSAQASPCTTSALILHPAQRFT
jgi:hypothetical protein